MVTLSWTFNGEVIEDSRHISKYHDEKGSETVNYVRDQGSRTIILHLKIGETLDLYCQDCSAGILYITFCVSLSQFDVE
jgi:hypothetical protein